MSAKTVQYMRYSFVTFTGVNRKGNVMLARLHFAIGVVNLFAPFLTKYQSERTSIRLLFEELARVLQLLLQRFVKLDVRKDNSAAPLLSVQRDDRPTQYGSYALNSIKTEVKVKVAHTRLQLVAWHSGRTSVSGRRTFPVLRSTCS